MGYNVRSSRTTDIRNPDITFFSNRMRRAILKVVFGKNISLELLKGYFMIANKTSKIRFSVKSSQMNFPLKCHSKIYRDLYMNNFKGKKEYYWGFREIKLSTRSQNVKLFSRNIFQVLKLRNFSLISSLTKISWKQWFH